MRIKRKDLDQLIEIFLAEQDLPEIEGLEDEAAAEEPAAEPLGGDLEAETADDPGAEDVGAEAAPEEEEGVNIMLRFTLPDSDTTVKLSVQDGTAQIVFEKQNGDIVDLNRRLAHDPTAEKEIGQDIIGVMMAAKERITDPVDQAKIRLTLAQMLGREGDLKFLDADHNLAAMKRNVISKYGGKG